VLLCFLNTAVVYLYTSSDSVHQWERSSNNLYLEAPMQSFWLLSVQCEWTCRSCKYLFRKLRFETLGEHTAYLTFRPTVIIKHQRNVVNDELSEYLQTQPEDLARLWPFPKSESQDKDYVQQRSAQFDSDNDNRGDDDDNEDYDSEELPSPPKSPSISRPINHCWGNKQLSWYRITK